MSLKEWYHNVTMNKEYLEDIPSSTYYINPKPINWTTLSRFRVRPFYYCSKPSTKRWKR